ncbi:MAG: sugar transferase [Patescibacteria group bacterium]|nr:sugar transferase [Patescibacteria group bacterium]
MKNLFSLSRFFLILIDLLLFFIALVVVIYLRFGVNFYDNLGEHFLSFGFLLPFYLLFLLAFNFYELYLLNLRNIFLNIINFFLLFLIFCSFYFYFGEIFFNITPRTNLFLFVFLLSILIFVSRTFFYKFRKKTNVYFQGEEDLKIKLERDLENNAQFKFNVFFDREKVEENSILIIGNNQEFDEDYIKFLISKKITTFDFISFYEKFFGRIPLEAIDINWVIKELIQSEAPLYFYLKRFIDLLIAIILLPILLLILPIVASLILLSSPGSIFFIQKRIGYGGKEFYLVKFRTMHSQNEDKQQWATGDEKRRIFFFGQILRKTHLDELPQVINLLKGEISIVGPRPEQPALARELEALIPFYQLRYLARPGITGWAQVNYKYPETVEETKIKLEFDLFYLKNHNLFLDLLIIIKTFQKLFF